VVALGNWHWAPNAAGLQWLAGEVAPHLSQHGVEVTVGGLGGEGIVGDRPGVTAVGQVPDAIEFLQAGRVIAVPSVAGSGVQVKTLDAIVTGRRVVATSTAMRGIEDPPPTVRVADDPVEFATELVRAARAEPDAAAARSAIAWGAARAERFSQQVSAAAAGLAASR
jgi:hypothetical protein